MKQKLWPKKVGDLMNLRAVIIQLCWEISGDMHRLVFTSIGPCLEGAVQQNGGHTKHEFTRRHFWKTFA
jgi:hypothetical protein